MNNIPGAIIIEGHVQGLSNTRSLGESGIPVYVIDRVNCVARYSKYCQKFFKCPPFESDQMADLLIKIAQEEGLKDWILLPSNDHAVLTLSRNKDRLQAYFKVITPGLDVIEKIYDKSKLLKVASAAGVPIPKTIYVTDRLTGETSLNFPVLTKGRFGLDFYKATGRKAFLSENHEKLLEHLAVIAKTFPINKTFTQELIPDDGSNKTISFTAFCAEGQIKSYWMGEKLREHPIRFGTATFAHSINIEECYRQSIPLLKELNYTGVCEVEYLKDPRDGLFKLIEINARTWLWVELAKVCGVDYAKLAYNFVNGKPIVFPEKFETGIYWINPLTDFVFSIQSILRRKLSISHYLNSILSRKKTNGLFKKNDIKPGLIYLLFSFFIFKSR